MSLKKAKKKVPVPADDGSDSDGGVSLFAPSIRKAAKKTSAASTSLSSTAPSGPVIADASLPADARVRWNPPEFAPTAASGTFAGLGIAPWQISVLASMAITKPTEIQQRCIPAIMAGKDVVGRAKTGSGKTAAFALPILHTLAQDPFGICGLVLTPTRELAFQIADQFRALGAPMDIQVSVVIGGLQISAQCAELEQRPHVVIATPGRLAQLLDIKAFTFHSAHLAYLVMDEADRLFEPQFAPPLRTILEAIPPPGQRQTLLFSATITAPMLDAHLAKTAAAAAASAAGAKSGDEDEIDAFLPQLMVDPIFIQPESTAAEAAAVVSTLDQRYLFVPQTVKETYLAHLLAPVTPDAPEFIPGRSAIVFTSTCKGCETIAEVLTQLGVPNAPLHSNLTQQRRLASLGKFRSGTVAVLVATDVASRGLDIPSVALVVNYDVPRSVEDYVHRTGRTARAGRGGTAVTLVSQYDVEMFKQIEDHVTAGAAATAAAAAASGGEVKAPATCGRIAAYEDAPEDAVLARLPAVTEAKKVAKVRLAEYAFKEKRFARGETEVVGDRQMRNEGKARVKRAADGAAAKKKAKAAKKA